MGKLHPYIFLILLPLLMSPLISAWGIDAVLWAMLASVVVGVADFIWTQMPGLHWRKKLPWLAVIVIGLLSAGGAGIMLSREYRAVPSQPLRRLVAYANNAVRLQPRPAPDGPLFIGYDVRVNNLGDDAITASLVKINVFIDGASAVTCLPQIIGIIPQHYGTGTHCTPPLPGVLVPLTAKSIIVEFQVDYDTVPESGVRQSYRKIAYDLTWQNGNIPILAPRTVEEWER